MIETPAEEEALWQRTNIFDARAVLGLYCYRAGYYPAALAQWTRIPERNRILRPEIARLLTEVDNRLALEKQETQPMRRDQLVSKEEPILTGNLPPADLPNPFEPIRSEETGGDTHQPPAFPLDDEDEEEHKVTLPLHNDIVTISATNGHENGQTGKNAQEMHVLSTSPVPSSVQPHQNWFARLLHIGENKQN